MTLSYTTFGLIKSCGPPAQGVQAGSRVTVAGLLRLVPAGCGNFPLPVGYALGNRGILRHAPFSLVPLRDAKAKRDDGDDEDDRAERHPIQGIHADLLPFFQMIQPKMAAMRTQTTMLATVFGPAASR